MASGGGVQVSNKQVILKDYVTGFPKESDMELRTTTITLKLPQGSTGLLVKNLYSCDPCMWSRLSKQDRLSYIDSINFHYHFSLTYILYPIIGYRVARVLESGNPEFNPGDLVWGLTGWEEHSVLTATESLFKIHNTNVLLSYYIGLLGMPVC
ncbi:hypothetical protein M0R45_026085 [Rubus argutus]|uniref:Oxidoreductase N-terminal domain-containing protein n=1 Tax=Rubus argutus TaxID=59490 RepID=A0AAW1WW07_RUBAR